MIKTMARDAGKRAISGGMRGAFYGIAGGFVMGAIGNVFGEKMSTVNVINWTDRNGKTKKFSGLEAMEVFDIYKDLTTLQSARECDIEAFNDSCRHLQSVIFLYNRFLETDESGIMDARKITTYSILATKSMNALLVSARAKKYPESDDVENSMMNIHLAFEEIIYNVRQHSKDILPEV